MYKIYVLMSTVCTYYDWERNWVWCVDFSVSIFL